MGATAIIIKTLKNPMTGRWWQSTGDLSSVISNNMNNDKQPKQQFFFIEEVVPRGSCCLKNVHVV